MVKFGKDLRKFKNIHDISGEDMLNYKGLKQEIKKQVTAGTNVEHFDEILKRTTYSVWLGHCSQAIKVSDLYTVCLTE